MFAAQCSAMPRAAQTRRVHLVSTQLFLFHKPDSLLFYSRCLHDLQGNLDRTKKGKKERAVGYGSDDVGRHQAGSERVDASFFFQEHKERPYTVAGLSMCRGDRATIIHAKPKGVSCAQESYWFTFCKKIYDLRLLTTAVSS